MKAALLTIFLAIASAACDSEIGPPLEISDVTIFAPLPGTSTSVAYMKMRNRTDASIVINSINSPQFNSIMVHETRIEDGVARMHMIDPLTIPARSMVELADGGMHLMLEQPARPMADGASTTLQIEYNVDGLVIVSTTIQSRFPDERPNQ
jgi:copper(I)-binding protein